MYSGMYNISKSTSPDGTIVTYTFTEENWEDSWVALYTTPYTDNYDIIPGNYYLLTIRFKPVISQGGEHRGISIWIPSLRSPPYTGPSPFIFVPSKGLATQGHPGIVKYKAISGGFYEVNIFFKATNQLAEYQSTQERLEVFIVNGEGESYYKGVAGTGVAISKFALVEYPSSTELAPDGFPVIMPQIGDVNAISPHNFLKWSTDFSQEIWDEKISGYSVSSDIWYNDGSNVDYNVTYNTEKNVVVLEFGEDSEAFISLPDVYDQGIPENQLISGEDYTLSFYICLEGSWNEAQFAVLTGWVYSDNEPTVFHIPQWYYNPETDFVSIEVPEGYGIQAGMVRAQPEFDARGVWYRCWVSGPCDSYVYSIGTIMLINSDMNQPSQGDKLYLYGPQFERGPHPGIYVPTRENIVLPNPKVKFTYDGYKWVPYPLDPYRGGDGRNRIPSQYAGGWNNPKSVETSPTFDENWFESSIAVGNPPYEFRAFPEAGFTGNYALRVTAKTKKELVVENVFRSPTTSRATVRIPGYQNDWGVDTRLAFAYLKGGTSTVEDANGAWGSILSPLIDTNRFTFSISGISTGTTSTFPNILDGNYIENSGILVEKEKASDYGGDTGLVYLASSDTSFNIPIEPFQIWIFSYYFHSTGRFDVWSDVDVLGGVVVEAENGQIEVIKIEEENIINVETYPDYYEGWVRVSTILDFSRNPSTSARVYIRGPNVYTNGFQAFYFDGFMLEKKIGLKNDPSPWTSELGPEDVIAAIDDEDKSTLPSGTTIGGATVLAVQEEGIAYDEVPTPFHNTYTVPPKVTFFPGGCTFDPSLVNSRFYFTTQVSGLTTTGFVPVLKLSSRGTEVGGGGGSSVVPHTLSSVYRDLRYQTRNDLPTHVLEKTDNAEASNQTYAFNFSLRIEGEHRGGMSTLGKSKYKAGKILLRFFVDTDGSGLWTILGEKLYTGANTDINSYYDTSGSESFYVEGAGSGTKFGIAIRQDGGRSTVANFWGSSIQSVNVKYNTEGPGGVGGGSGGNSAVSATLLGDVGVPYIVSGEIDDEI